MKVLLVDDDVHIRRIVSLYLRDTDVREAASADEALSIAAEERFDVAIVDLILPHSGGARVCQRLRESGGAGRIVVMSGDDSAAEAVGGCADAFLAKPFTREELLAALSGAPPPKDATDDIKRALSS